MSTNPAKFKQYDPAGAGVQSGDIGQELDRHIASANYFQQNAVEPAANPYGTIQLQVQSLLDRSSHRVGRIQYVLPMEGWYRVAIEDLGGVYPCCRITNDASCMLHGPTDTSTFGPDTLVLVLIHPTAHFGLILGAVPSVHLDGNHTFSDYINQGSNIGSKRDGYYVDYLTKLLDEGGVEDFQGNRTMDNTALDWGRITETGAGFHLDPQMAFMRATEACGIWAFTHSQALVMAGYDWQEVSGQHFARRMIDEGEGFYYHGETPYYWEQLGAFSFGVDIHRTISDEGVQYTDPYGKYEPVQDDMQPFARYEEFGGYLGQGRVRQMSFPPPDSSSTLYRYGSEIYAIGAFREHIGLDGQYSASSAKSITLTKRAIIPSTKQMKLPDDYGDCDSKENNNYRFAGQFGAAEVHKIGDIEYQDAETHIVQGCGVFDSLAYGTNWKPLLAFNYHKKDWRIEEESESPQDTNYEPLYLSELQTKPRMDPHEPEEFTIDHRYAARFYKLMSLFHMAEDGTLVLQGGMGCELKFVGGQAILSAPGGVFLQSGRTVGLLAGDDAVIRARNSVDVTAARKDVRIKADQSLMMLGGNGGKGGVLIESRTTHNLHNYPPEGGEAIDGSGIVLKSSQQVAAIAKDIYLRTGSRGVVAGNIVLDAGKGAADVIVFANNHRRFINGEAIDTFGFPRVRAVQRNNGNMFRLQGSVFVDGQLLVQRGVRSGSSIVVTGGHLSSTRGGPVGRLENPEYEAQILRENSIALQEYEQTTQDYYDGYVVPSYYEQYRIGYDDTLGDVSFSLRTQKDYGTAENFSIEQTHWQLLAEANGKAGTTPWRENTVLYQENRRMAPWPGYENWDQNDTYLRMKPGDHTMWDVAGGKSQDRQEPYLDPKYAKLTRSVPSTDYLVIDMPDGA